MDIKKEFNRLQALISGYALDNPEIDYLPISMRVELIAKEVELKLAELDEEIRYREWEELGMPPF